uniref:Uncharacterized protein n=1 Tax=Anguilla anguilla TaxID=7936 RepID=A0A0E9WHY1_ANGAN
MRASALWITLIKSGFKKFYVPFFQRHFRSWEEGEKPSFVRLGLYILPVISTQLCLCGKYDVIIKQRGNELALVIMTTTGLLTSS